MVFDFLLIAYFMRPDIAGITSKGLLNTKGKQPCNHYFYNCQYGQGSIWETFFILQGYAV